MQKWIVLLAMLTMLVSFAAAECPRVICAAEDDMPSGSLDLLLDARTDSTWSAFVLGGNSVVVGEAESAAPDAPQKHRFVLEAVGSGESLVRFAPSDGKGEAILLLAEVNADGTISTRDVTDSGALRGIVTEVMEEVRSAMLETEQSSTVIAIFPQEMALPVEEESVVLYTNGTMTLSEPGIVSVLAWETVPAAEQRN